MVEYLFWPGALALLGLILATDFIRSRFEHSAKSRRILGILAATVYGLAFAFVAAVLRPGRWLAAIFWAALLWLPLYVVAAFIGVMTWRRQKLADFDRVVRQLRREVGRRCAAVDRLGWQIRDLEGRTGSGATPSQEPRQRTDRATAWQASVDEWQGQGNLTRVRSLKVAEWRAQLATLDVSGLAARRAELEAAGAGADVERQAQLLVQLALIGLAALELEARGATPEPPSVSAGGALEDAHRRRSDEERELARLRADLERWQQDRAAFLRRRRRTGSSRGSSAGRERA